MTEHGAPTLEVIAGTATRPDSRQPGLTAPGGGLLPALGPIAPTVLSERLRGATGSVNFALYAEALGRAEEGEEILDAFDARTRAIAVLSLGETLEEGESPLVPVPAVVDPDPTTKDTFAGIILRPDRPRPAAGPGSGRIRRRRVTRERIPEMEGDRRSTSSTSRARAMPCRSRPTGPPSRCGSRSTWSRRAANVQPGWTTRVWNTAGGVLAGQPDAPDRPGADLRHRRVNRPRRRPACPCHRGIGVVLTGPAERGWSGRGQGWGKSGVERARDGGPRLARGRGRRGGLASCSCAAAAPEPRRGAGPPRARAASAWPRPRNSAGAFVRPMEAPGALRRAARIERPGKAVARDGRRTRRSLPTVVLRRQPAFRVYGGPGSDAERDALRLRRGLDRLRKDDSSARRGAQPALCPAAPTWFTSNQGQDIAAEDGDRL